MGSTGSYSASVSLVKKIDLRKKEENSSEQIEKFIKKHKDSLIFQKTLDEIKEGDTLISVDIYSEDEDLLTRVLLSDLGLKNLNPIFL